MNEQVPKEKKLSREREFIRWAMATPGIFHYPENVLREEMRDSDTVIGTAWLAWKAAWRVKS